MSQTPDDLLLDEIMACVASFTPKELEDFARLQGMTRAEWEEIIKNWKAERLN